MADWVTAPSHSNSGLDSEVELFIQQNTQTYTNELASYMEHVFISWYDKDILKIQNIFILLMNKTC